MRKMLSFCVAVATVCLAIPVPAGAETVSGWKPLEQFVSSQEGAEHLPFGDELSEPSTQAIVGHDSRERVYDTTEFPYSAVVRIYGRFSTCTGAMVGEDTVLTAAHCFFHKETHKRSDQSYICPGEFPGWFGRVRPFGCSDGEKVFVHPQYDPLHSRRSTDFALVKLTQPLGKKTGYFGYSSGTARDSEWKHVTGYPGDKESGSMWTSRSRKMNYRDGYLFYEIDAFKGQSGAPIYTDKNIIYGVHSGGAEEKYIIQGKGYNYASRIDGQKFAWITDRARNHNW